MIKDNQLKFKQMTGGFNDPHINAPFNDKEFTLTLGLYSGGDPTPKWVKKAAISENARECCNQCEAETLRMEKVLINIRKKFDTIIAKELRAAGYIKKEEV